MKKKVKIKVPTKPVQTLVQLPKRRLKDPIKRQMKQMR
jgi:hypothetical protein